MSKIRELQPAHKSDKVTVGEAARAFKQVQTGKHNHSSPGGRVLDTQAHGSTRSGRTRKK